MKKILASLSIMLCLALTMMGGGCSSCSSKVDETQNGGQTEVNKITTLEGIWKSEKGRGGEHEKIVVEGTTIKAYIHEGINHDYVLRWAGIYVPFTEPISEGEWTYENDTACDEERPEISEKIFKYSNGKLSCNMEDALGYFRDIYFTKVSE